MSDLTIVLEAAQKWADELSNYIIEDAEKRGDDEDAKRYSAELDTVHAAIEALKEGVEAPTPDTSINIYFTGDEDGPDMYGVAYDDEDSALEAAHENEVHGWRVPVQPLLEKAVRLDGDSDE